MVAEIVSDWSGDDGPRPKLGEGSGCTTEQGHATMTFRLIHVGLGGWGMDWETRPLAAISDIVEIAAIVEANEPTLEAAGETLGIEDGRRFTSLADALGAVEADGVLITAPVEAHIPLSMMAFEAGKHVLCEKPMAPTAADAVEAIRFAEERNLVYQISQNYRMYPAPQVARDLIQTRALGELGTISVDFRKWDNDAEAGTYRHYAVVHPLLYDMSIHHWDLMRMMVGAEARSVFVQATDPSWSKYLEEASASAIVTFENGIVVSYRGSWVSSDQETLWAGDWRMECEDGLIQWTSRAGGEDGTDGDEVTTRERGVGEESVTLPEMPVWGRSAAVLAFVDAVRNLDTPAADASLDTPGITLVGASARKNLGSVALMEATARSLASGKVEPVEIPEV